MHQSNDEKRSTKKRIYRPTWNYEKKIEEYEEIFRLYKRKENPYELVFKLGHLHRASSRLPVVIDFTLIEQEIRKRVREGEDLDKIYGYISDLLMKVNKLKKELPLFSEFFSGRTFESIDDLKRELEDAKAEARRKGLLIRWAKCIRAEGESQLELEVENPTKADIKLTKMVGEGAYIISPLFPISLAPDDVRILRIPLELEGSKTVSLQLHYELVGEARQTSIQVDVEEIEIVDPISLYLNRPVRVLETLDESEWMSKAITRMPTITKASSLTDATGWIIEGFLGEGGFYYTYLARKKDILGALRIPKNSWNHEKLEFKEIDQFSRKMIREEVEILHKVSKIRDEGVEHIIKLIDANEEIPYMVLEYCPKGDLTRVCGRVSEKEALIILLQIGYTLEKCYEHGIFHKHGDLKPENILIDKEGRPVLTDFSTALTGTYTAVIGGTARYFCDLRDDRADVYALGRVAVDLVKGREASEKSLKGSLLYGLIHRAMKKEIRMGEFLDEVKRLLIYVK
jgi:tRNA A-37 threonylcarbamoyl transferase component Bud32